MGAYLHLLNVNHAYFGYICYASEVHSHILIGSTEVKEDYVCTTITAHFRPTENISAER